MEKEYLIPSNMPFVTGHLYGMGLWDAFLAIVNAMNNLMPRRPDDNP